MIETLLGGVAIVFTLAVMYRAKAHADRAEAAERAMRRMKAKIFRELGLIDDEDRMVPDADLAPAARAAREAFGGPI